VADVEAGQSTLHRARPRGEDEDRHRPWQVCGVAGDRLPSQPLPEADISVIALRSERR
jgi:hypothetical protein